MQWLTFTAADGTTNETAFNDLHNRIMTLKGLPTADGATKDWAQPIAHPTNPWCAMPIDDSCMAALTDTEKASLQEQSNLTSAGWFPTVKPDGSVPRPWWGFLIWWR